MKHYAVTLFGNRTGATIDKDYKVAECSTYSEARKLIDGNGKWGNVREYNTHLDAVDDNNKFIMEVLGHGLSCARVKSCTQ